MGHEERRDGPSAPKEPHRVVHAAESARSAASTRSHTDENNNRSLLRRRRAVYDRGHLDSKVRCAPSVGETVDRDDEVPAALE